MARVLVADDDLFYRNLVSGWLQVLGHEVVAVTNGDDALRTWRQAENPFHCLILDVYMAGLSGLELLGKIRRIAEVESDTWRPPPIIIMTSDERIQTEVAARSRKAFSFLIKPFSEEEFRDAVSRALQQ